MELTSCRRYGGTVLPCVDCRRIPVRRHAAGFGAAASRRRRRVLHSTEDRLTFLLPLAGVFVFVCGWVIEPLITGEETVEVISIRKISRSPLISLDGVVTEPNGR